MEELAAFVRALDQGLEQRLAVANAANPREIVAVAASLGFAIDDLLLRKASRQLTASYWPWAGKSHAWRRQFFSEPPITDPLASDALARDPLATDPPA